MKRKSILLILVVLCLFQLAALGQTLLLPSAPNYATGEGDCSDIFVGAVSDYWRVPKGGRLRFWAVQQMEMHDVEFHWTVTNGKLLNGQGTWQIEVKAGNERSPGYLNATGFVKVELQISRKTESSQCQVNTTSSVMIGRFAESNTQVYDLSVTPKVLRMPCPANLSEADSLIVKVSTFALHPYGDPLTFKYSVDTGRIVGEGKDVTWNLQGAAPGVYNIIAGVEDSLCGVCRNTVTRLVKVLPCETEV